MRTAEEMLARVLEELETLKAQNELLTARVADMAERLTYREKVLTGYKEIRDYLKLTNLHRYMGDPEDPLPHRHVGGRVVAYASALDAWVSRRQAVLGHRSRFRRGREPKKSTPG